MRKWTEEERKRQAELVRGWQPWKKAGVKSERGKAISKNNAFKHGASGAETKAVRRYLKQCREQLKLIQAAKREE